MGHDGYDLDFGEDEGGWFRSGFGAGFPMALGGFRIGFGAGFLMAWSGFHGVVGGIRGVMGLHLGGLQLGKGERKMVRVGNSWRRSRSGLVGGWGRRSRSGVGEGGGDRGVG